MRRKKESTQPPISLIGIKNNFKLMKYASPLHFFICVTNHKSKLIKTSKSKQSNAVYIETIAFLDFWASH